MSDVAFSLFLTALSVFVIATGAWSLEHSFMSPPLMYFGLAVLTTGGFMLGLMLRVLKRDIVKLARRA